MSVSPIPKGFHSVTGYLTVPNAIEAMEFYSKAFGATQECHMPGPGGQGTMHAEFKIGDSHVMIADENPEWHTKSAATLGGSPVSFMIYVENADEAFDKAVAAGCQPVFPVTDMFWGDRNGKVVDPYGFQWGIATHIEDVSQEEMGERAKKWMEEMQQQAGG